MIRRRDLPAILSPVLTRCGQLRLGPAFPRFPGGFRGRCHGSIATPEFNVLDFSCFLQRFAAVGPLRELRRQHGGARVERA